LIPSFLPVEEEETGLAGWTGCGGGNRRLKNKEVRVVKGRRAAGGFSAGLKIFQPRMRRIDTNEERRDGDSSILLIPFIPSFRPAAEEETG